MKSFLLLLLPNSLDAFATLSTPAPHKIEVFGLKLSIFFKNGLKYSVPSPPPPTIIVSVFPMLI